MYKTPAQRDAERQKAEKATGMKGAVDAVQTGSMDDFPALGGAVAKTKINNMNYALRASEWALQKAEMEVREKEEALRKTWEAEQQKRREFEDSQIRKFTLGTKSRLSHYEQPKKTTYTNVWTSAYEATDDNEWVTVDKSAKVTARLKRREEAKLARELLISERLDNGEDLKDILRDLDGDDDNNSMEGEEQPDEHLKYANQGM